jgi:NitT/TauT family transport system substrate-binding protein
MIKRSFLKTTLGLACATAFSLASAQTTPIKFQLDWRFEGPAALFLVPAAKGIFQRCQIRCHR